MMNSWHRQAQRVEVKVTGSKECRLGFSGSSVNTSKPLRIEKGSGVPGTMTS